ncbi:MAG: tetratricopeptide repeat protein [bacterium]|nr:tetratricopeptide repeat protein [bacterium]
MTKFYHLYVIVGCVIVCSCADIWAQVLEHPYRTPVRDERVVARMINAGMIRRAHMELRALRDNVRATSAQDATPFRSSDIERASQNPTAADKALEQFLRDRHTSPEIPFAWMERGFAALEANDDALAIQYFERASQTASDVAVRRDQDVYTQLAHEATFWRAASLARTGHHAEALAAFDAVVRVDSTGNYSDRSLYAIGQLHERNGDPRKAIAAFALVRTRYPRGHVVLASRIREAQNELTLRRPERALDVLASVDSRMLAAAHTISGDSDTTPFPSQDYAENAAEEVLLLRSEAATYRGKEREALDSNRAFLQRYPTSMYRWHVQLNAGFNALALGLNDSALTYLSTVVDSVTEESDGIRQLALLYHAIALQRSGRADEARQAFAALASRADYPYQALALVETGQAAYLLGDYDRARKALERAEREAPDALTAVRAQILLGATLIEQLEWKKAAQAYERAEAKALSADDAYMPNKERYLAESRLKRGIAYVQAGERQRAIAALTDFLGNHPTDPRRDEATFWLAESMYAETLLKNAQELYEDIVNKYTASPRREEAMYGLAWTLFRKRDFDKSVAMFGSMLEAFPNTRFATESYARRGDGFYIRKLFRQAAEQYAEAVKRGGKSEEGEYSAYQRGQALYRAGAADEAATAMRQFVKNYSFSKLADDAMFLVGWLAFQRREYSVAIAEMRDLLNTYPTGDQAVRALYTIADAQYNLGDIDPSLATYRQVIDNYPSHALAAEAARSMQSALVGAGRTDEAIQIADALINANPQSKTAEQFRFRKAEIFYTGKNYKSAASELEAYMKNSPSAERQDEALFLLGKTYLNMTETAQARAAFTDLEKRFATSDFVPQALLELAAYFDRTASAKSADSVLGIVMDKYPNDTAYASQAGFDRAAMVRLAGDTARAIGIWTVIADRYPSTEYGDQSRYQLAVYHRRAGRPDSARFHLGVLAARVDQPLLAANALYDIGVSYVREKNHEEAVKTFTRVRTEFAGAEDWYTLSLLGLGESLEALGRTPEAKEIYELVQTLRTDDDFGKTAKARLKRIAKMK